MKFGMFSGNNQSTEADFEIAEVYTNHDYEKYAIKRDKQIGELP
jgi:hypothetical protein